MIEATYQYPLFFMVDGQKHPLIYPKDLKAFGLAKFLDFSLD